MLRGDGWDREGGAWWDRCTAANQSISDQAVQLLDRNT